MIANFGDTIFKLFKITAIAVLFMICLFVMSIVLKFTTSPEYREEIFYDFTSSIDYLIQANGFDCFFCYEPFSPEKLLSPDEEKSSSIISAEKTSQSISEWISYCIGKRHAAEAGRRPQGTASPSENDEIASSFGSAPVDDRTAEEIWLLDLSSSIERERILASHNVDDSRNLLTLTTTATIILGLLTTIAVSLSGAEVETLRKWSGWLKICAICLPVISTASAAVVAYIGPETAWSLATRTQASLSQLQTQIASSLWDYACPHEDKSKPPLLRTAIQDWSRQFANIQTVAALGGDSPSRGQSGDRPAPAAPSAPAAAPPRVDDLTSQRSPP